MSTSAEGAGGNRVLNVCNRLPVTVKRNFSKSSGGLVSAMESFSDTLSLHWVGWPGSSPAKVRRPSIESRLRDEFHCTPVFLSRDDINDYYAGFSNSVLWPLLHYSTTYVRHKKEWWNAYQRVNAKFRDVVLDVVRPDDIVWVHDYHLMLLPAMLHRERPELRIGYFLHTPFPSYEIFRCNPHREELLQGLLGANLLGFHTYGYMRHFRSSVLRLLGAECAVNTIQQDDHVCHLGVYPIGIDAGRFVTTLRSTPFQKECNKIRKTYDEKKQVLSVERLDYSKGLRRRLEAIDQFLGHIGEEERNHIAFIFISVPSREQVQEYQDLREDIESMIGQINGRYASIHNTPIHFIHSSVPPLELTALYAVADVMLVTPLIDGMNLVAKEFAACREDAHGVLILSEFTGAAAELGEAVMVNPYDIDGMVEALRQALDMPPDEQQRRMAPMRDYVRQHDSAHWARAFLKDIRACPPRETKTGGRALESLIASRFATPRRKACFLDYDGTLREFTAKPGDASPTQRLRRLLRRLGGIPSVDLYIISGRSRTQLDKWFQGLPCTLVAEHGVASRGPDDPAWTVFFEEPILEWKAEVLEVVREFAQTTPGSEVEEKDTAVVWHYRRCDPEFGMWKARELQSMLQEMASNLPVSVKGGSKNVEVGTIYADNGEALARLIDGKPYDVVLVAGDDVMDESMFQLQDNRMLCVKVGRGPTTAAHRVANVRAFLDLLTTAANAAEQNNTPA